MVFVHGIGEQKPGYSFGFRDAVRKKLGRDIDWREAFWADVAHHDEALIFELIKCTSLARKALVYFGGDVIGYIPPGTGTGTYNLIQDRFRQTIMGLPPGRVVLVGHSLGSVIISDGVWDMQKDGSWPANVELHGILTFGSPISLYAMRHGLNNFNQPIRPRQWTNIWYESDPIGFTLHINEAYRSAVSKDVMLGLYGIKRLISWVPVVSALASHGAYFNDERVADAAVELVRS